MENFLNIYIYIYNLGEEFVLENNNFLQSKMGKFVILTMNKGKFDSTKIM